MARPLEIVLARHGNTFGPGDRVVWVGARDNVALVERGREQAAALAAALRRSPPVHIYCGPLRRANEHAAIVAAELGVAEPTIDARLDELDYGSWSGRSDADIDAADLRAWRDDGIWPATAGWGSSEAAVRAEVEGFYTEVAARHAGERILAVSSSGRLRWFLGLVPGELERRVAEHSVSMRTGHAGLLIGGEQPHIAYWNRDPAGCDDL